MVYTEKAAFTDLPHSMFVGRCHSTENHTTATVAVIFDNTLKGHHVFWHKLTGSIYNDSFIQKCSTRNYTTDTGSLEFYAPHFRITPLLDLCPFVFGSTPFGCLHISTLLRAYETLGIERGWEAVHSV
jgi:hypothetical protein